ncbi:1-phosphatidylinositol phosphodiesterase, partial [Bacillus wiedmannii]
TVQDKYKESYDVKVKSIKDTIKETMNNSEDLNHLYVNFTSLSSGGTAWNSPYYYASYINPEIAAYIKQENPKRVGWVIQDYVSDKWSPILYQEVIRTNKSL